MMGVAIVGCGAIGTKRAKALVDSRLIAVVDKDESRAAQLAASYPGCIAATSWESVISRSDVDLVIVATSNDTLAPISLGAARQKKHVLVEKPAARSYSELLPLKEAARASGVIVKVGFNHRFHPAIAKAHEIFEAGEIGPLMYIRGRYGHGGRLGYEKEWRAIPAVSGGGELLDQGVHMIDLARWFSGEFTDVHGRIGTFFWKMPLEDNAFLQLQTARNVVAWMHVSCTEWKNLFSLEVFGTQGKLQVDGLGGSYGTEKLTFYRMRPEMGPPETTSWEFPGDDASWSDEYKHLLGCILENRAPSGGIDDALAALKVVERIYGQSSCGRSRSSMETAS